MRIHLPARFASIALSLGIIGGFLGFSTPIVARAADPVEVDRIENGFIYFKSSAGGPGSEPSHGLKSLAIEIMDPYFLGPLHSEQGGTSLLLSGHLKNQDKSLFLLRPAGGSQIELVYPGRILDPKTKQLLLESRAFYGKCLAGHGDVYVAFQREYVDRKRGHQSSVFIATPKGGPGQETLDEKLLEKRLPRIKATLKLVRSKACREIEGRNRVALSKPLDLKARKGDDEGEDSGEDAQDTKNDASATDSEPGSAKPGSD